MRTRVWRSWVWAGASALAIGLNAADEPKPPAPPRVGRDSVEPSKEAIPAAVDPAPASQEKAAPETPAVPPEASKPGLPPVLDQVARLSASSTDEAVICSYIEKAATPYRITGNDIARLRELGVSQKVLLALINHSQTAGPSTTSEIIAPQNPPAESTEASSSEVALDYQDALAPYGTWYDVPGYGWCWQPTVVVVNGDWRPYCDDGYWRWSDYGWYWQSHYTWGWAPFHYGRWFSDAHRGWLWCPDRTWGPAWVSWRNSDRHCGWAPLPPGACYGAKEGWTHHGKRVGTDCDFGLRSGDFTFVAREHFSERQLNGHSLRGADLANAYRNTTVRNNYLTGPNNRVINQGVASATAAARRAPFASGPGGEAPRMRSGIPFSNERITPVRQVNTPRAPSTVTRTPSAAGAPGTRAAVMPPAPGPVSVARTTTAPRSTAAVNIGTITPPGRMPPASLAPRRTFTPSLPQLSAVRSIQVQPTRTFAPPSVPGVSRMTSFTRAAPRASIGSVAGARPAVSVTTMRSSAPRPGVSVGRTSAPSTGSRAPAGRTTTATRSSAGQR